MSSSELWNSARCYNRPCKASLTKQTCEIRWLYKIRIQRKISKSRYFKIFYIVTFYGDDISSAWRQLEFQALKLEFPLRKRKESAVCWQNLRRFCNAASSIRISKFEYLNHMRLIRKDYQFRIRMSRGRIELSYVNLLCTFGPWTSWWRSCGIQLNTGNIYYRSIWVLWFSNGSNGYNSNLVFMLNS